MEPSSYLPLLVIAMFASLFAVERLFPLRSAKSGLFARVVANLAISSLAYLTALIVVRPAALHTLSWTDLNAFGLVQLVPAPDWAKSILGFLLLDLITTGMS
jgi:hypothetical protein